MNFEDLDRIAELRVDLTKWMKILEALKNPTGRPGKPTAVKVFFEENGNHGAEDFPVDTYEDLITIVKKKLELVTQELKERGIILPEEEKQLAFEASGGLSVVEPKSGLLSIFKKK